MGDEKTVHWAGSSYKDFMGFPNSARRNAGYQLHRVQIGLDPDDWKPMRAVGPGVNEIRLSEAGNAFRIIYVAIFADRIFVLHAFQKKTQKTPNHDITLARTRFNAIVHEELP